MHYNLALLLAFLLPTTFCNAQSSTYHPFPDAGAYWQETATWVVWTPNPCPVTDDYTLFINGDTVIGAFTYHKIYQTGNISSSCPPPGYDYYNLYKGAFREDSAAKQIYVVPVTAIAETLLYDFNLGIGDTLLPSYNNLNGNLVIGIDSVLVGSNYHKRFLLSPLNPLSPVDTNYAIIEGVGSTFGMFNEIAPAFESSSTLNCFNNAGSSFPANASCSFDLSIANGIIKDYSFSIYPNPVTAQTTIQSTTSLDNTRIVVSSCVGIPLFEIQAVSGNTITFDFSNLIPGTYLLTILTESGSVISELFVFTGN